MRYQAGHKEETRKRILEAAGREFKARGFAGAGVQSIMKAAGLTHGGFYAHFRNKEALFGEAVLAALYAMREHHERWTEGLEGADWLRAFLAGYLDRRHAEQAESGCPAPALVSELGRVGEGPRREFEKGLDEWATSLADHLTTASLPASEADGDPRDDAALGVIAACIGGLALSRAVADDDLTDRILASTRRLVERAVGVDIPSHEET